MAMSPRQVKKLFQKLQIAIPNPITELRFENHFQLLIAVILSAQATDQSVNKVTPVLFNRYPTAADIAVAGLDEVLQIIKTIGLANTKAKNICKTCQILAERYNGEIPSTRDELVALPGVGRKTANVILNTAFQQPVIAVDTHVFRVSNRSGLTQGKTPEQVEEQLMKIIPKAYLKDAHHLLVLHGRYVCKAQKPLCQQCPIQSECEFLEKLL